MKGIGICGMVCALPDNRQFTMDQTDRFDPEVLKRIVEETGVESTYRTLEKQTASDLCFEAAADLLDGLGWERESVGVLVFVSHAMDYSRPATSCVLQKRLGLSKGCASIDIGLGCSGFIYGLSVIGSMMQSMQIERGILVCGDLSSKAVDPATTSNLLFGDIGAAVAFEKKDRASDIPFALYSDGNGYKKIFTRGGGFRHPEDRENRYADMAGMDVMAFSISEVPRSIVAFMKENGLAMDEIDLIALHQANQIIIRNIGRKIKAPEEKLPIVIKRYGNSSSSSAPLAICDYVKEHERRDLRILASGFGIGLSWGVAEIFLPADAYVGILKTNRYYDDDLDVTVDVNGGEST